MQVASPSFDDLTIRQRTKESGRTSRLADEASEPTFSSPVGHRFLIDDPLRTNGNSSAILTPIEAGLSLRSYPLPPSSSHLIAYQNIGHRDAPLAVLFPLSSPMITLFLAFLLHFFAPISSVGLLAFPSTFAPESVMQSTSRMTLLTT